MTVMNHPQYCHAAINLATGFAISFAVGLATGLGATNTAHAQGRPAGYPERPVRFVVAQAAGSGVDLLTRIVARKLSDNYGQQFIVENRPGANGIIEIGRAHV